MAQRSVTVVSRSRVEPVNPRPDYPPGRLWIRGVGSAQAAGVVRPVPKRSVVQNDVF